MAIYISKVVEVHTYKTDWCKLDENSVKENFGSIKEFKRKFYEKEIDFDEVVSQRKIKIENHDEYYANMKNYKFNRQINSLCSNTKTVYDEEGKWLEFQDF
tara:strand:+ start:29 stop:331 length:303 start_codon:yes stop_codon:yes gene_type:complete